MSIELERIKVSGKAPLESTQWTSSIFSSKKDSGISFDADTSAAKFQQRAQVKESHGNEAVSYQDFLQDFERELTSLVGFFERHTDRVPMDNGPERQSMPELSRKKVNGDQYQTVRVSAGMIDDHKSSSQQAETSTGYLHEAAMDNRSQGHQSTDSVDNGLAKPSMQAPQKIDVNGTQYRKDRIYSAAGGDIGSQGHQRATTVDNGLAKPSMQAPQKIDVDGTQHRKDRIYSVAGVDIGLQGHQRATSVDNGLAKPSMQEPPKVDVDRALHPKDHILSAAGGDNGLQGHHRAASVDNGLAKPSMQEPSKIDVDRTQHRKERIYSAAGDDIGSQGHQRATSVDNGLARPSIQPPQNIDVDGTQHLKDWFFSAASGGHKSLDHQMGTYANTPVNNLKSLLSDEQAGQLILNLEGVEYLEEGEVIYVAQSALSAIDRLYLSQVSKCSEVKSDVGLLSNLQGAGLETISISKKVIRAEVVCRALSDTRVTVELQDGKLSVHFDIQNQDLGVAGTSMLTELRAMLDHKYAQFHVSVTTSSADQVEVESSASDNSKKRDGNSSGDDGNQRDAPSEEKWEIDYLLGGLTK
ncbi:hypothetical protein [Microbulbifer sp. JMSA003]|uniref:hypothetical protein n=1 Tax=Microbulbifer sp. JMSA003 TaxID=3243369 RepID=UPI004039C3B1